MSEDKQLQFDIQEDGDVEIVEADEKNADVFERPLRGRHNDGLGKWNGYPYLDYIVYDSAIFDDQARETLSMLPKDQQYQYIFSLLENFYDAHERYKHFASVEVYENPMTLLEIFKTTTINDLRAIDEDLDDDALETWYNKLQARIKSAEDAIAKNPIDIKNLVSLWPILRIRELFTESDLLKLYDLKVPRTTPKERAQRAGALMTTAGRLADISKKDFTGWLDEVPNSTAYLYYVGPHYWDEIEVDEGGNLYEGDEAQVRRAARSEEKKVKKAFENGTFGNERPKGHERINKEIMRALLKATISENGAIRTIYLPTFAHELNENYKIDVDEYDDAGNLNEKGQQNKAAAEDRAKEAAAARESGEKVYTKEKPSIMQQFYSLDYWVGILDREDVKRTAVITGLNREAQTIDVVLPYIEAIRQAEIERSALESESAKRKYMIPAYHDLVHSNIASERDKKAVDLVYTIIDGLLQRGSKPASKFKENQTEDGPEKDDADEKVVYRIKYSTLINKTPLLAMAYKNANTADKKYKLLTRTFSTAFKLLRKKTDLYDYFIDLKIPEIPPTIRTLESEFVVTHKGKNTQYKAR